MRTLYTILFFLDTLALILFMYWFFKLADKGMSELTFMTLLCGIIVCIALLVYIIVRFLKHPESEKQH
jgi:hypothetical protein